jgi:hypothetical protein
MAIDAVTGNLGAQFGVLSAFRGLVAGKTVLRKSGGGALRPMDIMTGCTGQLAGAETAAGLQQLHLVAVDVDSRAGAGLGYGQILFQIVSWGKG